MQVADLRPRLRPRGYAAADAYLARPYDARWCVEGPGLPPLPVDTREEAERLRDLLDAAFDAGAKCGARERTRALAWIAPMTACSIVLVSGPVGRPYFAQSRVSGVTAAA